MVNASLNWASIVGIVLAVGGALLYFMRSFKPALARDYDVFFAAVGLLCGGILFFQGWRLDPILQFGQFLLAGTTVFFAYESVRLRGVTTEQARRSSFFDDEEPPPPPPYRSRMGGSAWSEEMDRFQEPASLRRRIRSRVDEDIEEADDFYRPRRPSSRAAIPERAASRGRERDREMEGWDQEEPRRPAPESRETPSSRSRYSAGGGTGGSEFGARRQERSSRPEPRRGSRPVASSEAMPRSSRNGTVSAAGPTATTTTGRPGVPQGSPLRPAPAGGPPAAGPGTPRDSRGGEPRVTDAPVADADYDPLDPAAGPAADRRPGNGPASTPAAANGRSSAAASGQARAGIPGQRPRDNSSRFDD